MSVLFIWMMSAVAVQDTDGPERLTESNPAVAAVDASAAETAKKLEPRGLFEIHKQLRRLLRDEAVVKERQVWERTVVDLVKLYGEITRDDRLLTSNALNSYRVKLRARLMKVQKRLEREQEQAREQRGRDDQLAAGGDKGHTGSTGSLGDSTQSDQSSSSAAGARGGASFDDGLALVELIQRTISPKFWDVNGGPGSIVYYRQWHALVIRATPEIHRQIGGEIGGLRK